MDRIEDECPRYKMCLFLFGNVDKQGLLEDEYARDKDLSSINQIDACHVTEVEANIRTIVCEVNDCSSPSVNDVTENTVESMQPIEPVDYYDESEVIHLDSLENSVPLPDDVDVCVCLRTLFNISFT